jgi:metallophosphoesterase superfamily enzyme
MDLGDRQPRPGRAGAPVRRDVDEACIGPLTFRHEPVEKVGSPDGEGEVCGHLHPAARVRRFGRSIRRSCFVTDGTRLVLPAFGALTGGLNVTDEAYSMIFRRRQFSVFMLGNDRLFPFTASRLVGD